MPTLYEYDRFGRKIGLKVGTAYIRCTNNNVFMTFVDQYSVRVLTFTPRTFGLQGPKRSTMYAAQRVGIEFGFLMKNFLLVTELHVKIIGPKHCRRCKAAYKAMLEVDNKEVIVRTLTYKYTNAHNGVRWRKKKRK